MSACQAHVVATLALVPSIKAQGKRERIGKEEFGKGEAEPFGLLQFRRTIVKMLGVLVLVVMAVCPT